MYDLQTWMGAPSIYVYDCSNAGIIVESFQQFADQHEKEYEVNDTRISLKDRNVNFKNILTNTDGQCS